MRNIVETRIRASRTDVWNIIADFPRYKEWNPFTPEVIGRCAAGEDVRVLVRLGGKPFWMPRRVTLAEPGTSFSWTGRAWYSVLTPGQRTLHLKDDGAAGTLLIDDEYIGGISFLMSKRLCNTLVQRMREFGEGLKAAAESRRASNG